jgi:hypothetical protein
MSSQAKMPPSVLKTHTAAALIQVELERIIQVHHYAHALLRRGAPHVIVKPRVSRRRQKRGGRLSPPPQHRTFPPLQSFTASPTAVLYRHWLHALIPCRDPVNGDADMRDLSDTSRND